MKSQSPIGRISYRKAPLKTSFSVKEAWERLEAWAREYIPDTRKDLNRPASVKKIRELEKCIGESLPDDLRESLQIHDGQKYRTGLIVGLQLLPVESIMQDWKRWSGYADDPKPSFDERCSSFPANAVKQSYFDPGWIPLTYDGGGNHIAVDLNPGPRGYRGQVIVFGRDDEFHPVLAWSWGQFLTDLADELEAGNFCIDRTDPDYPAFNIAEPNFGHFHQVGKYWSRGKLGLKLLSTLNKQAWGRRK